MRPDAELSVREPESRSSASADVPPVIEELPESHPTPNASTESNTPPVDHADVASKRELAFIDGRVTRAADGTPIESVHVSLRIDEGDPFEAFTNEHGLYGMTIRATQIPRTLVFHHHAAHEYHHPLPAGALLPSTEPHTVSIAIDTGWSLRVRLVDPLGLTPLEANVTLEDLKGRVLATLSSVDDAWSARDLPVATAAEQQWHVVARVAHAGVAVTPITPMPFLAETRRLTVLLERAGSIAAEIRVVDGRPAANAQLSIANADPPLVFTTDDDGRVVLDHVPSGVRVVTGAWTDPTTQRTRRFHSPALFVESERTTEWSHVIDAGVTLAGRVVAVGGTPRPGLTVNVRSAISADVEPLDGTASTDGQGRFTLHDIDAGPKVLRVFDGVRLVAERHVAVPPQGRRDVVIAFGGHVWHDVTTTDTRSSALPRVDITLLASEHGVAPRLAQSWQGVTAGLQRDDPDGPDLGGPSVVSGFEYVGTRAFRQTKVVHPRPFDAPPPGLEGPHVRTIEPPVDISLRAFFEPALIPHAQTDERGRVTIDIDADRAVIGVGGRELESVPFAALASTDDIPVHTALDDWLNERLDLWVVASNAGRVTEAVRLVPGTSTSNVATLAPSPMLVVFVTDTTGRRLHELNVVAEDDALSTRIALETEPLGPAAFVIITDARGDDRTLDVTIEAPDHARATIPWTPGETGALEVVDVQLEQIR